MVVIPDSHSRQLQGQRERESGNAAGGSADDGQVALVGALGATLCD